MEKTKVLVAMSGGVDSSVAALLMKKKGYEVFGVFMKNWSDSKNEFGECSWKDERNMAIKVCSLLQIPLITLDSEKEYRKEVIAKMFSDYRKGITPNPDIDCNKKIKFPLLLKAAKKIGADFLVTVHYSKINKSGKKFELFRGKDESKDQSYFLYALKQNELKSLLFPVGDYTKKEIREIARKSDFPNWDKKSTVGICFVGKVNLKKFLQKRIKPKKGKILNPEGKVIGKHDGIYYYTIGQRIGSRYGIEVSKYSDDKSFVKRWYIAKKDAKKKILIAAPKEHPLNFRKEIFIKNTHWISEKPKNNSNILARIRQVGELLQCKIIFKKNKIQIILNESITGISEGQAIVLYKGKKVLGGGEIGFS